MRELSFMEHLGELRRRILICVVAVLVGSAVSFVFYEEIIRLLSLPAYDLRGGQGINLVFIEITELLTTAVKVSFVAGFVLALPVILYHAIMFIAPGLTRRERRCLYMFLPLALLAFASGVAFCYFVLIPPALRFLLGFSTVAEPLIRISNFVNLMIRLLFWMGLAFETPLVMYLLAQLGIVSARQLSSFRRIWIVIAFILGAIITPTFDPVNQALVAGPLLVLYELGILLAKIAGRRRPEIETAIARR